MRKTRETAAAQVSTHGDGASGQSARDTVGTASAPVGHRRACTSTPNPDHFEFTGEEPTGNSRCRRNPRQRQRSRKALEAETDAPQRRDKRPRDVPCGSFLLLDKQRAKVMRVRGKDRFREVYLHRHGESKSEDEWVPLTSMRLAFDMMIDDETETAAFLQPEMGEGGVAILQPEMGEGGGAILQPEMGEDSTATTPAAATSLEEVELLALSEALVASAAEDVETYISTSGADCERGGEASATDDAEACTGGGVDSHRYVSPAMREAAALQRVQEERRKEEENERDWSHWREWSSHDGELCARTCSWPRIDAFMCRMRSAETSSPGLLPLAADAREFNIDYIIRQLEVMRNGPLADEVHVLIQLQRGSPSQASTPAAAGDALGVCAATVRMSRRILTIEFKVVYVLPQMRNRALAKALVHFVLDDVRQQTLAGGVSWQSHSLHAMKCFVTLPHCMQTSAKFWASIGFELGQSVDAKDHKQATLPTVAHLKGNTEAWTAVRVMNSSDVGERIATRDLASRDPSTGHAAAATSSQPWLRDPPSGWAGTAGPSRAMDDEEAGGRPPSP